MHSLKTKLKKRLEGAKRITILGVGSELRGDDAAGMLVAGELKRSNVTARVLFGETAPENLTGEIKKGKPTHLVIIDSADMGKPAGTVKLIEPDETKGITFCTHQLPLAVMTDYLKGEVGCDVVIIGIQPKKIEFGGVVSRQIRTSVKRIAAAVKGAMKRRKKQ